jgi:hypothetical protein
MSESYSGKKLLQKVSIIALAGVMACAGVGCSSTAVLQTRKNIQAYMASAQDFRTDREVLDEILSRCVGMTAFQKKSLSKNLRILLGTESGNILLRRLPKEVFFEVSDGLKKTEEDFFIGSFSKEENRIYLSPDVFSGFYKDLLTVALAHEIGHAVQNEMRLGSRAGEDTSFSPLQVACLNKLLEAEMFAYSLDTIYQVKQKDKSFFKEVFLQEDIIYSQKMYEGYAAAYEKNLDSFEKMGTPTGQAESYARRKTMGEFIEIMLSPSFSSEYGSDTLSWNFSYNLQGRSVADSILILYPQTLSSEGNDPLYRFLLKKHADEFFITAEKLESLLPNRDLAYLLYKTSVVLSAYETGTISKEEIPAYRKAVDKTDEYQAVKEAYISSNRNDLYEKVKIFPSVQTLASLAEQSTRDI